RPNGPARTTRGRWSRGCRGCGRGGARRSKVEGRRSKAVRRKLTLRRFPGYSIVTASDLRPSTFDPMRLLPILALLLAALPAEAQPQPRPRPRARDLGIDLGGTPGPHNAITDVAGVEVGHATIIRGEGRLEVGTGPVRTGVTTIWPRGRRNM